MMKNTKKRPSKTRRKSENTLSQISSEPEPLNLTETEAEPENNSLWLKLAGNPNFVGAMNHMLFGCLACGTFLGILFAIPQLGGLYAKLMYGIASFIPKQFIPPGIYIPGQLTPPVLLLIIGIFTYMGYRKGATPPEIKSDQDTRSFGEKLFEFVAISLVGFLAIYARSCEDHPESTFVEKISHPVFIGALIVGTLGIAFYVFYRHRSQSLLFFTMYAALGVGFTLFVIGMIFNTILNSFWHALNF